MKCPRCNKEGILYKLFKYSTQVMCPECHYYIHKKELKYEETGVSEQDSLNV